jgi:secreted trypsin-like serine protease
MGEQLDPVGFGRCAMSEDAIRRRSRAGGRVVGLTAETLEMRASICPGDSGGPVLAKGSHEVVGVVSLSAMDGDDRTRKISVMARVDTYRALFANARLIADGASPSEIPPLVCAP